jgi:sugar phosphate isomerase/epimerase
MQQVSRREFLIGSAALIGGAMLEASPLGLPIGSQTYPHRQMIRDGDFAGLLKTLKGIGVDAIELCSPLGYAEFAPLADGKLVRKTIADAGMTCVSGHFSLRELRENQGKSIDWAHDAGITQMFVATLGGGNTPAMEAVKHAADEYNTIASVASAAGIQQGLHNEGFELSMVDGKRTYDLLFDLLDPKLVKFQFQMSTITAGLVGAEYFLKYPGRFNSMHLQDVDMNAPVPAPSPKGAAAGRRGGRRPQVAVGQGTIDWVKTFTAAKTGGVKNYFVEQNWELTQQSVAYLKTLKV